MAKTQGATVGGQGILLCAPVSITDTNIAVVPAVATLPTNIQAFAGKYDATTFLELATFCSSADKVGIISTAPALDANPKTLTVTTDKDDNFALRWQQRYNKGMRLGLDKPAAEASDTASQYEDGLEEGGQTDTEDTSIAATDTFFFVWLGPKFVDDKKGQKIIYGFAGLQSSSGNFTTAFKTKNQFTYTLVGAPQAIDATIDISDYVFNSAVGASFGSVGGANGVKAITPILDGTIGQIFGDYDFTIPENTSIIVDRMD